MRPDLGGNFTAGADRHAYNPQIGADDGRGVSFHDLIGEPKLRDALRAVVHYVTGGKVQA